MVRNELSPNNNRMKKKLMEKLDVNGMPLDIGNLRAGNECSIWRAVSQLDEAETTQGASQVKR